MKTPNPRRTFLITSLSAAIGLFFLAGFPLRAVASGGERGEWDRLSPTEQEEIKQNWKRFQDMDEAARAELLKAMQRFDALPADQKERIEKNYSLWKTLPPEQQELVRQRYLSWKELPDHVKKALRAKSKDWDKLSESERRRLLEMAAESRSAE